MALQANKVISVETVRNQIVYKSNFGRGHPSDDATDGPCSYTPAERLKRSRELLQALGALSDTEVEVGKSGAARAGIDPFRTRYFQSQSVSKRSRIGASRVEKSTSLVAAMRRAELAVAETRQAEPRVIPTRFGFPQMSTRLEMPDWIRSRLRNWAGLATPPNSMKHMKTAWRYWCSYCQCMNVAPMRTNKFANAGFDLQGEHEEQQLQLGFIAFLPSVMVGRRVAPDG